MGVCSIPVVSQACSIGTSVAQGVAGDFIKTAAQDAANAANSILETLVTAWTNLPVQLGGAQGGAATSLIQGDLRGVEVWAGVLGVLVAAARMALFRRGEPLRQAVSGLLNMVVVGGRASSPSTCWPRRATTCRPTCCGTASARPTLRSTSAWRPASPRSCCRALALHRRLRHPHGGSAGRPAPVQPRHGL